MEEKDEELKRLLEKKYRELMERFKEGSKIQVGEGEGGGEVVLTSQNFDRWINSGKPVLVDFWAEWCMPCRMVEPIFKRLAQKYGSKMIFGRLNVDQNPDIARRYRVYSIPTFILFYRGEVMERMVGAMGEGILEALIQRHIP